MNQDSTKCDLLNLTMVAERVSNFWLLIMLKLWGTVEALLTYFIPMFHFPVIFRKYRNGELIWNSLKEGEQGAEYGFKLSFQLQCLSYEE